VARDPRLRMAVLGPLELWRDGQSVMPGGARTRAVLGLLAARAGHPVRSETIIDLLWPENPPPNAPDLVRSYIDALRSALGDDDPSSRLLADEPPADEAKTDEAATDEVPGDGEHGYRLRLAGRELDLLEFTELAARARDAVSSGDPALACRWYERAAGLWRGEPLADVDLLRGHPAVAGLTRRRVAMLLGYAEAAAACGQHDRVIPHLRRLAEQDRLDERVHARLMIALAGAGQPSAALQVFELLRERLDTELGVSPGAELADAHAAVLRAQASQGPATGPTPLASWPVGPAAPASSPIADTAAAVDSLTPPPPPVPPPGPLPRPRQLPPPAPHFTGRAEQLKELSELLDQTTGPGATAAVSVIAGTAGVGKTSLAVYWAHQVAGRFPDGQLYVNLRGFDPSGSPVAPADAIRSCLDALGIPAERMPPALDARAGLLRSLLAGKRMLILLDNARDAAQVRPLLPGTAGCLTIITSRHQPTGLAATHGAHVLSLDVLSGAEAAQFLARRLGSQRVAAEPQAATELTRLCARLPLALAIIAARAAVRPDLPLAALVAELTDSQGMLDALNGGDTDTSIRAVFSWSYRQLDDQAALMFRLLGTHPGPDVSVPAAASLAGRPTAQVRPLLTALTTAHLIGETAPGRFGFHDLLRAYAAEQAQEHCPPAKFTEARLRALDHYLQTGFAGALLLAPHRAQITLPPPQPGVTAEPLAGNRQALAWFEAEHQVILAAMNTAAGSGHDSYAWQLAWTVVDFLDWRGHWHDLEATQQTALAACQRLGDVWGQAHARRFLARATGQLGRYDESPAHLDAALQKYGEIGDTLGQARCHIDMADAAERQGRYPEAIGHAQQALDQYRAAGNQAGQASALNAVGWCHAMAGDHALALSYCQQAIVLQREMGDVQSEAGTWDSIGFAHHHLGQYAEAIACYRRALALNDQVGHRHSEAEILTHLADTQHASGEQAAAQDTWRQALTILDDLRHVDADRIRARLAEGQ
jgi:DNA-binding SARP family transcriptional activator/tetratricopeptide (TPR) repeat protein